MTSRNPILQFDSVTKSFGAVRAVDGISLDIYENEFFALLGPSGCGKTTLLRLLAGFENLTSGQILLLGKDIAPLPPEKRPLNLMFQSYALFPHMTVRQNLSYGLEMENLPKTEIRERVDAILATTDLSALADRKPEQLSGGQKQRVALARALIKRPKVLLLDEPLGALDKKLRERMQLELKRLQHDVGITFIIVTHDQEEALVMADRIAILNHGKILQCGSPVEIYDQPGDRFVASFIGVMNFIDGKVDESGRFVAGDFGLDVPNAAPSTKSTLAVRPENIAVSETMGSLFGQITDIAYHGLDRVLHVQTSVNTQPLQVRVTAAGGVPRSVGDTVNLTLDAARCRIFS